jgi:hypothetical protein
MAPHTISGIKTIAKVIKTPMKGKSKNSKPKANQGMNKGASVTPIINNMIAAFLLIGSWSSYDEEEGNALIIANGDTIKPVTRLLNNLLP